jgi:hypothetical protein
MTYVLEGGRWPNMKVMCSRRSLHLTLASCLQFDVGDEFENDEGGGYVGQGFSDVRELSQDGHGIAEDGVGFAKQDHCV